MTARQPSFSLVRGPFSQSLITTATPVRWIEVQSKSSKVICLQLTLCGSGLPSLLSGVLRSK
jgi:hypothetical protein